MELWWRPGEHQAALNWSNVHDGSDRLGELALEPKLGILARDIDGRRIERLERFQGITGIRRSDATIKRSSGLKPIFAPLSWNTGLMFCPSTAAPNTSPD